MWPFKRTDTRLDQATTVLSPFVEVTLEGFDNPDAWVDMTVRRLTECYVFGAVQYLVSYDEMPAGSTQQLFADMLSRHFAADDVAIEASRSALSRVQPGGNEQLFMIEGASALRRMLVNNDQDSGKNLQMLLDKTLSR